MSLFRPSLVVFCCLLAISGARGQDKIERLKDGLVRIEVRTGPNRPTLPGTGFVVAANSNTVTIMTARHLFYTKAGDPLVNPEPWVTFHIDRLHSRQAKLLPDDSEPYEFAVLEVSGKDLIGLNVAQLPRFDLRLTNLAPHEHVLVLGSDGNLWPSPELVIASLSVGTRPDKFIYSGTGIGGGFSGSPVVDLKGLLVGIHQGETDGVTKYGRAQRMKEAAEALGILGVTAEFGGSGPPHSVDPDESLAPPTTRDNPSLGRVRKSDKDGLNYVWIPPGKFTMGCSEGDQECSADEKPAHEVTLTRGFWMGQTPVTVGAWERYTEATGKQMPEEPQFLDARAEFPGWGNDRLPMVMISWADSKAFCSWAGKRLPTEAEYEYAARAGTKGARYGNVDAIAWFVDNSGNTPKPVGLKAPNQFKLYDMLGSVWAWTADWYKDKYDASSGTTNPAGPRSGQSRVLRGGSWHDPPINARASVRAEASPDVSFYIFGCRCVGDIP